VASVGAISNTIMIRVWTSWVMPESRAKRMARNDSLLKGHNDLVGRNGSGHSRDATMPSGIRRAHRDDERGRADSFLRRLISIGSKDPMP